MEATRLSLEVVEAIKLLADVLGRRKIRYALIGGLAVTFYSVGRFTDDVDLILDIPQLTLPGVLDDLKQLGFELEEATVIPEWIQHGMVKLRYHSTVCDWMKPVIPLYAHIIRDATEQTIEGQVLRVSRPEGLILLKLLADRPLDLADLERIADAMRGKLDMAYIEKEWESLGEPDDPRLLRFKEAVKKTEAPPA